MFVKDLRVADGFPLSDVIIVDNSLLSFALQPDNGIPISSYFWNPEDSELSCLASYLLNKIATAEDVRTVNQEEFKI